MNESLIIRIEEVLKFYANKNNYPDDINKDKGHMANSILEDIEKIKKETIYNDDDIINSGININDIDDELISKFKEIFNIK